ncbi:prepilin-type N-terminal cleavage/methylation domain-containing protein [Patescibacteria group bacterium]|nr:MAG: prepilin-type N-terminal cleavage/methylation domain-containing protein [Patescibacteria group bacterium]
MRRIPRGFTIVELLVVVAVIGILATITLIGFNRYQADSRDSQRSSEATVIAEALEKYYDKNGEYPSCNTMKDIGTNVAATLGNIDPKVLLTPQAASDQTNSIDFCSDITTSTPTDSFAYVGDGSSTCSTGTGSTSSCLQFKLEYKQESTGTIQSITSRRTANILTSGNIADLAATPYSFSQINLAWTAISGAASYNVQYSLNSNMSSPTPFTPAPTTNAAQVTGLSLGTTYYLQVQPVSSAGVAGNWSNTATTTTYTLGTPDGTAVADPAAPSSQIKLTWAPITNATSYTVIYNSTGAVDGSGVLSSPTTVNNATSPYYLTGLPAGTTRYFQIKANAAGYSSGYSSTDSAITQVPTPTCTASTLNSNRQITVSWNTVSVATSYTLQYSTNSGFSGASTVSGISTTSQAVTGLNNGTTYYFQVEALVGSTTSTYGACPSASTGVDGPTGYGWSSDGYGVRNTASGIWINYPGAGNYYSEGMTIYGSCAPGATVVTRLYQYYAFSNNTGATQASLMDWTWNNQDRFTPDGINGYKVWWQGWVACQSGSNRQGDVYLGNAGPYT